MSDQLGFDFGAQAVRFVDQLAGTWIAPEFTYAEYIDRFARADGRLSNIVGPGRPLLRRGGVGGLRGSLRGNSGRRGSGARCRIQGAAGVA